MQAREAAAWWRAPPGLALMGSAAVRHRARRRVGCGSVVSTSRRCHCSGCVAGNPSSARRAREPSAYPATAAAVADQLMVLKDFHRGAALLLHRFGQRGVAICGLLYRGRKASPAGRTRSRCRSSAQWRRGGVSGLPGQPPDETHWATCTFATAGGGAAVNVDFSQGRLDAAAGS